MNISEISKGVRKIIAQNSRYTIDEVRKNEKLDKYISSYWSDKLTRRIVVEFRKVDGTKLINRLYTEIKTIEDLIDYVALYYKN